MQIFLKTISGNTRTFFVNPSQLVSEFKLKIQNKLGFIPEEQRLIYAGRQLNDFELLSEYGIQNESTINLLLRLPGGVIDPTLKCLAEKYNCKKNICRKCYARLPIKATKCRKKGCGGSKDLRPKKKLR